MSLNNSFLSFANKIGELDSHNKHICDSIVAGYKSCLECEHIYGEFMPTVAVGTTDLENTAIDISDWCGKHGIEKTVIKVGNKDYIYNINLHKPCETEGKSLNELILDDIGIQQLRPDEYIGIYSDGNNSLSSINGSTLKLFTDYLSSKCLALFCVGNCYWQLLPKT